MHISWSLKQFSLYITDQIFCPWYPVQASWFTFRFTYTLSVCSSKNHSSLLGTEFSATTLEISEFPRDIGSVFTDFHGNGISESSLLETVHLDFSVQSSCWAQNGHSESRFTLNNLKKRVFFMSIMIFF